MSHTIAVVGAGRVGTTLGRRWAGAGHAVRYGVRDPDDGRHDALRGHAEVADISTAASGAAVVLLALPWSATLDVAAALPALGDTVVLDATNPLAGDRRTHDRSEPRSGGEQVAAALDGGRVVKAFNTTGAGNMADPSGYDPPPVMWLAGDDPGACEVAAGLARDIGFEPVVAGGLGAAGDLEHLAMTWIRLAWTLGDGPDFVITRQRRATR